MDTKRASVLAIALTAAITASGCFPEAVKDTPPPPSTAVTLESLICAVQEAILATRREGTEAAGLAPAEATVTAALTFKKTDSASIGAKLKVGIVEWGPNMGRSVENGYANTVSIKFIPGSTHMQVMKATGEAAAVLSTGQNLPLDACTKPAAF